MNDRKMGDFKAQVYTYYKAHGRHTLPWRKTRDPYKILVSEIMLQQTQVDRVIPYYRNFMKKYPTAKALASTSLAAVLTEWSGLGYNRRAKFLFQAAVEAEKNGGIPREYDALRALPGIGDYTAKAVRVFAFNEPEALIETNVRAVFIHHFFPRTKKVEDKKLLPIIEKALKGQSPREWYAALMDYGSHLKRLHPNPSRRSKHHTKQAKFEGSLRQVRGAILKAHTNGASLAGVRRKHAEQFEQAFQSLVRDGLMQI